MKIYTIGHSTRRFEDFLHLLQINGVKLVVDVRSIPGSRRNPQFNENVLASRLKEAGIDYLHMAGLGGLRHPRADSPNGGWRNASFRGFADYMQTPDFRRSLEELIELARNAVTALMCAEALPWRCHRSLIADALVVRGIEVEHVLGPGERRLHTVTPFAKIENLRITYPA